MRTDGLSVHFNVGHCIHTLDASVFSRHHVARHLACVVFMNDTVCGFFHHLDGVQVLGTVLESWLAWLDDPDFAPFVEEQRDGTKPGEEDQYDKDDLCRIGVTSQIHTFFVF